MKHTIEMKLPKLFGKKKIEDQGPKITTEIDTKAKTVKVPMVVAVGAPVVIGMAASYLVGHNQGLVKGLKLGQVIVVK